jgi:hypothetical protein
MPKCGNQTPQAEAENKSALTSTAEPGKAPTGALKLQQARQYLGGLSVPTMHRLVKRGLLRPNRATRHLLFPLVELERFLREGMN